jgi:hypothetical protein
MRLRKIIFYNFSIIFSLGLCFGIQSCQEPITVGSDLLDDEQLELGLIDTIKLSSKTIEGENIVTYRLRVDSRTHMIGQLSDPVFGKLDATVYVLPYIQGTKPDFTNAIMDSMVLGLTLDSLGSFGQKNTTHKIEAFQLVDRMRTKDTAFANTVFSTGDLIGSITTVVRPKDSISVVDHITQKSKRYIPHVRIPIKKDFALSLFENATANAVDTLFANLLKGIAIKSTPQSDPSLIGFNLTDAAIIADNPGNKLNVYYHKSVKNEVTGLDTIQRLVYQYQILGNTVANYTIDKTNSIAQTLIANPAQGNENTLIQALGGVKTEISFDNISALKDVLITKVEIDVYVSSLPGQNTLVSAPNQLIASRYNSDGKLELIPDILQIVQVQTPFGSVFGGQIDKSKSVYKYTINVTNHVKRLLADPTYRPEVVLGILGEAETAAQAVLYGAKHSTYPMKVRVSYAK